MARLISRTSDGSFSVEVPFSYIKDEYYAESSVCKNAIDKTLAEIERLSDCLKDSRNESNKKICEMQSHINCLKTELAEVQRNKLELPEEPIKVADMLISATGAYTDLFDKEKTYSVYDKAELKQIAEHLLVYCNSAGDE